MHFSYRMRQHRHTETPDDEHVARIASDTANERTHYSRRYRGPECVAGRTALAIVRGVPGRFTFSAVVGSAVLQPRSGSRTSSDSGVILPVPAFALTGRSGARSGVGSSCDVVPAQPIARGNATGATGIDARIANSRTDSGS